MNYLILVNRDNLLDKTYIPDNLVNTYSKYKDNVLVCDMVYKFFLFMKNEALLNGYDIDIMSGYRSYKYQDMLYKSLINEKRLNYTLRHVALGGASEHQTGLAYDIGSTKVNVFANSREYQWMKDNAYKYGFIERFTKRYEHITGFRMETWHYRYVGKDIAKYIHENNISLEEYWAVYLDK